MNPSCTQEIKFIELNRDPTNATSKQEIQKSAKIRNTITSFTNIVMKIMQGISLKEAHSPQKLISTMVPSSTGAPIKSLKPQEAVQMQKQEQCKKGC